MFCHLSQNPGSFFPSSFSKSAGGLCLFPLFLAFVPCSSLLLIVYSFRFSSFLKSVLLKFSNWFLSFQFSTSPVFPEYTLDHVCLLKICQCSCVPSSGPLEQGCYGSLLTLSLELLSPQNIQHLKIKLKSGLRTFP